MVESRVRAWPAPSTLAQAKCLLGLTSRHRSPAMQLDADGSMRLEWEAAERGWLTLTVAGSGQLGHSAVIGEDEVEGSEVFGEASGQAQACGQIKGLGASPERTVATQATGAVSRCAGTLR